MRYRSILLLAATLLYVAIHPGQPPATATAGPGSSPSWVTPIRWDRFTAGLPTGAPADLSRAVLLNTNRYALQTWFPNRYGGQAGDYLDLGGTAEGSIRPPSSEALALAVTLATGAYDESRVGVGEQEASQTAVRLVRSLAHVHKVNQDVTGWGDHWQSALWAYNAGIAGWLLWDRLSPRDRIEVEAMVSYEADRFVDYAVPYYQDPDGDVVYPGDSKSEENAWNGALVNLAATMMPGHPNRAVWLDKAIELMVSSYSRPSDLGSDRVVNGREVRDWLNGSNIGEDGTVVNHGFIHPDYMTSIANNTSATLVFSLAGLATPEAARFNADLVYGAFSTKEFASPPYRAPGGTVYRAVDGAATSDVYYPQGNDWGTHRRMHFALIDTQAALFGFDTGSALPAADWAAAHAGQVYAMQGRFADGRTYGAGSEDTYSGREQWVALLAGRTYLTRWLVHSGAVGWTNQSFPVTPPERPGAVLEVEPRGYYPPGTATPYVVRVRNVAQVSLTDVRVALSGPAGWQLTPAPGSSTTFGWIRPGESARTEWLVTPPAGTAPGSFELDAAVDYRAYTVARTGTREDVVRVPTPPPAGAVWLSDLPWLQAAAAYPPLRDVNNYGDPLTINTVTHPKGLWLDDGWVSYYLGGRCRRFDSDLGIDDAMNQFGADAGSVTYEIWLDGVKAYDSGLLTGSSPTATVSADLTGAEELRIVVTDGGDGRRYDWADWGSARLDCGP